MLPVGFVFKNVSFFFFGYIFLISLNFPSQHFPSPFFLSFSLSLLQMFSVANFPYFPLFFFSLLSLSRCGEVKSL